MGPPEPVNEDVVSSAWVGKRKTSVQVLPVSEAGMSKLKIEETVEEISPKKEVPGAVVGDVEEMGMMRCGNWKALLLRDAGQPDGAGGGGGGGGGAQLEKQDEAVRVISPQLIPPGVR